MNIYEFIQANQNRRTLMGTVPHGTVVVVTQQGSTGYAWAGAIGMRVNNEDFNGLICLKLSPEHFPGSTRQSWSARLYGDNLSVIPLAAEYPEFTR